MTFRTRGIELPSWTTQTGAATNKVWLEYLRREQRMERTRVEHEISVAYALAGSPEASAEDRFAVVDPPKQAYFAHMNGSVHRTAYKRRMLEKKQQELLNTKADMDRLDWIASDDFNLADWFAGK
jgi:hypothetical protein